MKKLFFAILMSVLLVMALPAMVLAAPVKPVNAELQVMAVYRNLTPGPDGHLIGTVWYQGKVTSAYKDSGLWCEILGADVIAMEEVKYLLDTNGKVIQGKAQGTATIVAPGSFIVIEYRAKIGGNVVVGPADDDGRWKAAQSYGLFEQLNQAKGTWTAAVALDPNLGTFVGTVSLAGTY